MKTRLFFSSLIFAFTTIMTQAALLENVDGIVTKARAHLGSEEALKAVHSLQYRGTVTLNQGKDADGNEKAPLVGKAILSFEKPSSQKIEFIFDKQSLVTGFNGFEGYEFVEAKQEAGDPIMNIRSIGGQELRRNKAAAMENLMFFRPFSFDTSNVKDKGTSTVDGKEARQIDFIHNGQFVFSRFFDTSTGDLLKTTLDTGMITVETGELMADGIRFSEKTVGILNGEVRYEMTFEEVLINPEFESDMFDYPMY